MANQLTSNAEALPLFFTEEIFLIKDEVKESVATPIVVKEEIVELAAPQIEVPMLSVEPILSTPTSQKEPTIVKMEFKFKGLNKKNILILVKDPAHEVSGAEGVELLRKIVLSIGLQGADFALVNYANYPNTSFNSLKEFFNCKLMFAFGVVCNELQLNEVPSNQLVQQEGTRMVFAENLQSLDSNKAGKIALWAALKELKI